jgi:hypothetical protein
MERIAIQSVKALKDQPLLYLLLSRLWEEKGPLQIDDYLFLGQTAYNRGNYSLAKEAFQLFLEAARKYKGKIPKTHLKAAESGLMTWRLADWPKAGKCPSPALWVS